MEFNSHVLTQSVKLRDLPPIKSPKQFCFSQNKSQRTSIVINSDRKRNDSDVSDDSFVVQDRSESPLRPVNDMKQLVEQPLPMVQTGYDLAADMIFGWKPKQEAFPVAPIPLHYSYGDSDDLVNSLTGSRLIYLGPRIPTSLQVHKLYANQKQQAESQFEEQSYASYQATVPKNLPYKIINKEPPREFIGMDPKLDLHDELRFDSMFECGNLDKVTKISPSEYDCYMRVDTNATGHQQWFYFSVQYNSEMFKKHKVTFNIVNFTKPASLYQFGMRICCARRSQNFQWHKTGENIKYGKGNVIRKMHEDPGKIKYYYRLSFQLTLEKSQDKIFIAYCYPYSFSKLTKFLSDLNDQSALDFFKQGILCRDLSGIEVPLVTITSRLHSDPKNYHLISQKEFQQDLQGAPIYKQKKFCILSSRVHPGETPASWMMQGFLKCLTGDSFESIELRKRVVFKIVPMINPDGVICGNYRTSMVGQDLNRRYENPDFRFQPTVWSLKNMCEDIIYGNASKGFSSFAKPDDVLAFVDMHGHSRKKNVFVYGPPEPLHSDKYYKLRLIPKILSERTDMFRYHGCRFQDEKDKRAAARLALWNELGIFNCFTFEASFHGYFDEQRITHEFTPELYQEMGAKLVSALYEYLILIEEDERLKQIKQLKKLSKFKPDDLSRTQTHIYNNSSKSTPPPVPGSTQQKKRPRYYRKTSDSTAGLSRAESTTSVKLKLQNPNEPDFESHKRNLPEIFQGVRQLERQPNYDSDEPGTSDDEHYKHAYNQDEDDEDNGELDDQQMKKLQDEIVKAVTEYRNAFGISKIDYYGGMNKIVEQKNLRQVVRVQKKNNYQQKTLSVAVKRRSYKQLPEQKKIAKKIEIKVLSQEKLCKKTSQNNLQKVTVFQFDGQITRNFNKIDVKSLTKPQTPIRIRKIQDVQNSNKILRTAETSYQQKRTQQLQRVTDKSIPAQPLRKIQDVNQWSKLGLPQNFQNFVILQTQQSTKEHNFIDSHPNTTTKTQSNQQSQVKFSQALDLDQQKKFYYNNLLPNPAKSANQFLANRLIRLNQQQQSRNTDSIRQIASDHVVIANQNQQLALETLENKKELSTVEQMLSSPKLIKVNFNPVFDQLIKKIQNRIGRKL